MESNLQISECYTTPKKSPIFYEMINMLSYCGAASSTVSKSILESRISKIVGHLVADSSFMSKEPGAEVSGPTSGEALMVLVNLMNNVLAAISYNDIDIMSGIKVQDLIKSSKSERWVRILAPNVTSDAEKEKRKNLFSSPLLANQAAQDLLAIFLEIQNSSLPFSIKETTIQTMEKLIFFTEEEELFDILAGIPVSSFVAGLLRAKDDAIMIQGLKICSLLLQKLPNLFKSAFLKEGVVFEMKNISDRKISEARDVDEGKARSNSDVFTLFICPLCSEILKKYFAYSDGMGTLFHAMVIGFQMLTSFIIIASDIKTEGLRMLEDAGIALAKQKKIDLFIQLFVDQDNISIFEVKFSGSLDVLRNFVEGNDLEGDRNSKQWTIQYRERLKLILNMFESKASATGNLEAVVDTLQKCLAASENLVVRTSSFKKTPSFHPILFGGFHNNESRQGENRDPLSQELKALGVPVRIRLQNLDGDNPASCGAILIEPLATFAQIGDYLRPRLRQLLSAGKERTNGENNAGPSVPLTRSRAKELEQKRKEQIDDGSDGYNSDESEMVDDYLDSEDEMEQDDEDEMNEAIAQEVPEKNTENHSTSNRILQRQAENERQPSTSQDGSKSVSLKFFIDGTEIAPSDCILRCMRSLISTEDGEKYLMDKIWSETHKVDFKVVPNEENEVQLGEVSGQKERKYSWKDLEMSPIFDAMSGIEFDHVFENNKYASDSIAILKFLESIVRTGPLLDGMKMQISEAEIRSMFINPQITSKVSQQLKDVLLLCSNNFPCWCTQLLNQAKFLFPFELRKKYFACTSFGVARSLTASIQNDLQGITGSNQINSPENMPFRLPRINRQKVRISRSHILESARKVFERYAQTDSRLEVEFYHEAGSGLGPTLEFYTLLSHEFQKTSLHMWRGGEFNHYSSNVREDGLPGPTDIEVKEAKYKDPKSKDLLVRTKFGLFPRPLRTNSECKDSSMLLKNFHLLGRVVAKALQDERLMDIPLSLSFYKLVLNRILNLDDLRKIDTDLFLSLSRLTKALQDSSENALVDGVPIEDLSLYFVLPGEDEYELCDDGGNTPVTSCNLAEYIDLVVDATIGCGVERQINAFRQGFECILPVSKLQSFYEDEIELMLCGTDEGETWSYKTLEGAIKCDHGYTPQSGPVVSLLNVLSDMDAVDQRRFLRFVTGAPRLPHGGLAALNPQLTVVKKTPTLTEDASNDLRSSKEELLQQQADQDLPSVMTCANYLKLPPYSSEATLKDRLMFAIREGQGSFDLS